MAIIEGGKFICYEHEFETDKVKTWDRHCHEFGHTLLVEQQCKKCGHWNVEREYPYPERFTERMHSNAEEDQNFLVLKCEKCGV